MSGYSNVWKTKKGLFLKKILHKGLATEVVIIIVNVYSTKLLTSGVMNLNLFKLTHLFES
jgi:hypothetical protein